MLVAATHGDSKRSIMSHAYTNNLLMCFNKKMLSMVRMLNVEFHVFSQCWHLLQMCHQVAFMVLSLLYLSVALGMVVTGFVVICS